MYTVASGISSSKVKTINGEKLGSFPNADGPKKQNTVFGDQISALVFHRDDPNISF